MSWKNGYTEEELEIIKEASTQAKNRADEIKKRREAGTQMNYEKRDAGGSGVNRAQQANKIPMLGYDKFHGGNQLTPTSPANIDGNRHNPIANQYRRKMVANQLNGAGAGIAAGDRVNLSDLGRMNIANNGSTWDGTGGKSRLDSFNKPALSVNGSGSGFNGKRTGLGIAGLAGIAGLGLGAYGLYNYFKGEGSGNTPAGNESQFSDNSDYSSYVNGTGNLPGNQYNDAMQRIKERIDFSNSGKGADAFNAAMNGDAVDAFNKNMGIDENGIRRSHDIVYQNPALFAGVGAAAGLGTGAMIARRRRNV